MIEFAPYSPELTYDEAVLYCQFLEYNGHTGWRVPTHDEYLNNPARGWYVERGEQASVWQLAARFPVKPVRDVCSK